jgi:uncharacterized protein (TIGR03067 family)
LILSYRLIPYYPHASTTADDGFQILKPDGALVYGGTYRLDPAAVPPAIDFVNTEGEASGVTWSGIWQLDDTGLVIAGNAPDPSRPRPNAFAAPDGSGYIVVTFAPGG